jgi:hypothetical protein
MAIADGNAPQISWEKAGPTAITLTVGESPIYIVMEPRTKTSVGQHP